jgi:hypothetical protein
MEIGGIDASECTIIERGRLMKMRGCWTKKLIT